VQAACWAHARRKFFQAVELNTKDQTAIGVVAQINALFEIDQKAREEALSREARHAIRFEKSKPLLDETKSQIEGARSSALPKSLLAKACHYTLTLWPRLTRFLEYPELELSNNWAENAIRPVALRRNYEQLGIRQSLTRAKRDLPRWALDMADDAAPPVFA
jgi:transposase